MKYLAHLTHGNSCVRLSLPLHTDRCLQTFNAGHSQEHGPTALLPHHRAISPAEIDVHVWRVWACLCERLCVCVHVCMCECMRVHVRVWVWSSVRSPVEGGGDAEEAQRGGVLQHSDDCVEYVSKPRPSSWTGQGHCECLVHLRLSVQNCPDLQSL